MNCLIASNPHCEQDPNRSELRRIQLNLSIVRDLLDKIPEKGDDKLSARYQVLKEDINTLQKANIQLLREELTAGLNEVDSLFAKFFPSNKTDFGQVHRELSEIQEAIERLAGQFRQSFEDEDVADLKLRLKEAEDKLLSFESAVTDLTQFEDRLRQSIALTEYLEYLDQLAKLPFKQHPLVKQASKLSKRRPRA